MSTSRLRSTLTIELCRWEAGEVTIEKARKAILEAIAKGKLGYTPKLEIGTGERAIVTLVTTIPDDEFDTDGYLLLPELVERLREKDREIDRETRDETAIPTPQTPYISKDRMNRSGLAGERTSPERWER